MVKVQSGQALDWQWAGPGSLSLLSEAQTQGQIGPELPNSQSYTLSSGPGSNKWTLERRRRKKHSMHTDHLVSVF